MKVFSVAEMIEAERTADAAGHSYADMMETAGRGVAEAIIARHPDGVEGLAIMALVGPGNNGGDALVAGRYLYWAGANVVFYLFKPRDPAADDNYKQVLEFGAPVLNAEDDQRFRVLRLRLNGVDMLLDGLLGTGVTRPISGELGKMMRQVKSGLAERAKLAAAAAAQADRDAGFEVPLTPLTPDLARPQSPPWRPMVVAIDCPSGLNCNTGELDPLALPADLTVTFAGPKHGHFLFPGAGALGELVVADIGIDPRHTKDVPTEVGTLEMMGDLLPERPLDSHKGTFGKVIIAGGSDQYRGAPVLAAKGAFRAGSGLVGLLVPNIIRHTQGPVLSEVTFMSTKERGELDGDAAEHLIAELPNRDAALVGPGLGQSAEAAEFLFALLPHVPDDFPIALDADALNLLARHENWWERLPEQAILTPHPGEMQRLCQVGISDRSRIELAREKAAEWGCVIVLKGAHTVVAAPSGRTAIIPIAHPILATAGSGDVLGGVIVSLLGQGLSPFNAATAGAYWHAAAGLRLAQSQPLGALAREIADALPAVYPRLRPIS